MIRVLAVVRHPVGGIRTYLKDTYAALPPGKYDIRVIVVHSLESGQLTDDLANRGMACVEVSERRPCWSLLRAVETALRSRPDIVHSHGFTSGIVANTANLLYGVPHVVTSHDVFRTDQFAGPGGRMKARLLAAMLGRADTVHSVSADAQDNLRRFLPRLDASKLAMVANGVDVNRFVTARVADHARPSGERSPFVFAFFGRLMPQKGFSDLVNAVQLLAADKRLRERFLVRVVSDGGYIREHRADIAARGLSDCFDFRGFVPDISTALDSVDAVVMPSLWEACPLVPMEMLAAGCPLIASACVGLREVVKDTPALVVAPGAPAELATAMRTMMNSYGPFHDAARAFVDQARRRFDVRNAASGLDGMFDRTLAERQRCARIHAVTSA